MGKLMTVREVLHRAGVRLRDAGSSSPRLDAEVLLSTVIEADRLELYRSPQRILTEGQEEEFEARLSRRAAGEPVAYISGTKEFWSLSFAVSGAVLIPRPETEILVEEALKAAERIGRGGLRIADIGTGSGAIAVALATELPEAYLTATDISADALSLARTNANVLGVGGRIEFLLGSMCEPLTGDFDIILSNPPYIPAHEFAGLPRGVRDFEPRQALLADGDGTACHRELIGGAAEHLLPGGWLLMEMGAGQRARVERVLRQCGLYDGISVRRDYGGMERVISALRG